MRRLNPPGIDFATALKEAIKGIGDTNIQTHYTAEMASAVGVEAIYHANGRAASLYTLPRVASGKDDPIIHGLMKKSDLTKLYTEYFVPESKPARYLYNKLKVTANGKCPICGDIGHVKTLDHYVPKANFPLYSVLPGNLIPCCRDCNSEKMNAFPNVAEEQTLHPYWDDDKYFSEKWVHARVIQGTPPVIEYFVDPPTAWSQIERRRVNSHFTQYELADKFSLEAGADLPETVRTRNTTLEEATPEEFSAYLLEKSNNLHLPTNNWRRVLFKCLADDIWFCSTRHDYY